MKSMKIFGAAVLLLSLMAAGLSSCLHGGRLSSIAITPAEPYLAVGTTRQLNAVATFSDNLVLYWTASVTWSSSDETVATVSNEIGLNGLVIAVGKGTTTITATDMQNNVSASVVLNVATPSAVTVFPVNPWMPFATAHQFTAIALFSGTTSTLDVTNITYWALSSSDVATVANIPGYAGNGLITTASVTGDIEISSTLTITDPPGIATSFTGTTTLHAIAAPMSYLTVTPVNPPPVSLATTTQMQFTAQGTFTDYSTTPDLTTNWIWSSSDTAVATIDSSGLSSITGTGSAVIYAVDPISGKIGSSLLTVNQ